MLLTSQNLDSLTVPRARGTVRRTIIGRTIIKFVGKFVTQSRINI